MITVVDSYHKKKEYAVEGEESVYRLMKRNGLELDSPCQGNGSCHKCVVRADGRPVLACATRARDGMVVEIPFLQGTSHPE